MAVALAASEDLVVSCKIARLAEPTRRIDALSIQGTGECTQVVAGLPCDAQRGLLLSDQAGWEMGRLPRFPAALL